MAASLTSRFYFLLLLLSFVSANIERDSYPIGVSFGQTYITAVYLDSASGPVVVASIKGGGGYCAFMAGSAENEGVKIQYQKNWYIREGESLIPIPPEPEYNPKTENLFAEAIRSIQAKITNTLEKPLDITFVAIPGHFNDTSSSSAGRAVMANEKGIIQPWQVRRRFNVVRLAYGLNSCEGFGLPDTCEVEDDLYPVLFVDYNREYLELSIAEVGEWAFGVIDNVRLHNHGENRLDYLEGDLDKYQHEILHAIESFKSRKPVYVNGDLQIVMLGDASKSAFNIIRGVIVAVFPGNKVKIRDTIDPFFAEAVGAAQWAKLQVLRPELLEDFEPSQHFHDEL